MKLLETERAISAYASGLELAGAGKPAAYLQSIAELLGEFSDRTMNDLARCYGKVQEQWPAESGTWTDEPMVADIVPHLDALKHTLTAGGSPAAKTKDLGLLINLLRDDNDSKCDSRYLSTMLKALRQALMPQAPDSAVREFIDRLNLAKGSDQFERVLSELTNSGLKKEHVIEIARGVYGGLPKGLSRKAALAYIRKPHDAFMSAKRGIEATGGRSAA